MTDPVWTPTIHKAESEVECDIGPFHLKVWHYTSHSWSYSIDRRRSSQKFLLSSVFGEAKTKAVAVARAMSIANEYHMWNRTY